MDWLSALFGGATASLAGDAVGAIVGGTALTVAVGFAVPWLAKNLPPIVAKFAKKALDVLDWDTGDAVIDQAIDKAVLALVVAAEKKWPDRGEGKAKKKWVVKKLLSIFPYWLSKKNALIC